MKWCSVIVNAAGRKILFTGTIEVSVTKPNSSCIFPDTFCEKERFERSQQSIRTETQKEYLKSINANGWKSKVFLLVGLKVAKLHFRSFDAQHFSGMSQTVVISLKTTFLSFLIILSFEQTLRSSLFFSKVWNHLYHASEG